jgi:hypothetical protein
MKLIKILEEQLDIETQKNELKDRLTQYKNNGCAPGIVIPMTSTNPELSYSIKQESTKTPGKFRYLYDIKKDENTFEKRIATPNNEGKLQFTGMWSCRNELKYTEKSDFKRQGKTPQQTNAIKTYLDAGWEDLGGILNPVESPLYDVIDMKDMYGDLFPESYVLVKKIESIDTNEVVEELNNLVNTRNFGDRRTCKQIISKYNVAKEKNAPVNDAVLKNMKTAVNACVSKIDNFYDLGKSKKIIEKLNSDTENQRWSLNPTTTNTTPSTDTTQEPQPS